MMIDLPAGEVTHEDPVVAEPTAGELAAELAELRETLRAVTHGEVDAVMVDTVDHGPQVFTLSTADRPYRTFVENMRDGAVTLSEAGDILYANGRVAEILQVPPTELAGRPLARYLVGAPPPQLAARSAIDLANDASASLECDVIDANGSVVPVLIGLSVVLQQGSYIRCITVADLTERKAMEGRISRLGRMQAQQLDELHALYASLKESTTHDSLTHLPLRSLLVERTERALLDAEGASGYTVILYIDLDHFKLINDRFGRSAGNSVLIGMSRRLLALVGSAGTVARVGDDEFAVLVNGVSTVKAAVEMAADIVDQEAMGDPSVLGGHSIPVSVGIATSLAGRGTAEQLISDADVAMYKAKSLGGRRVEVFDTVLGRDLAARRRARVLLEAALEQGRLVPHFQPIVSLRSLKVVGMEALARIVDADGAMELPDQFIPFAEQQGMLVPLGTRMLTMACAAAAEWKRRDDVGVLSVAVNVSAQQLSDGDFLAIVRETLDSAGLDPHRLLLELTETAAVELIPGNLAQLAAVRDLGVEIGLDDFGTGYASLAHLRRLPISFVKIDKSFVDALGTNKDDERIVGSIVGLASSLGLRCIAEGVETHSQLDLLRAYGCDEAQGFLWSTAEPEGHVPAMVAVING